MEPFYGGNYPLAFFTPSHSTRHPIKVHLASASETFPRLSLFLFQSLDGTKKRALGNLFLPQSVPITSFSRRHQKIFSGVQA